MEVSALLLRLVGSGPGGSARVSKRAKGQAEEKWTLTHEHLLLFINSRLQLLHEQMMIIDGGGGPRSQCLVAMGNLQVIQSEALWQVCGCKVFVKVVEKVLVEYCHKVLPEVFLLLLLMLKR